MADVSDLKINERSNQLSRGTAERISHLNRK